MEISAEVVEGLQLAGDSAHISDKCFEKLVQCVCKSLLDKDSRNIVAHDAAFSSIDRGMLKEAYSALATLALEAAKHDRDAPGISHVLEDCKFSTDRISIFTNIFLEEKANLQVLLSSTGNNPPHIVDVDWRLDYYIKNNNLEKVNQPTFLINLKTEECGSDGTKDVQFACSQEQLQDLVGKLKDACKSVERVSQL